MFSRPLERLGRWLIVFFIHTNFFKPKNSFKALDYQRGIAFLYLAYNMGVTRKSVRRGMFHILTFMKYLVWGIKVFLLEYTIVLSTSKQSTVIFATTLNIFLPCYIIYLIF